MGSMTHRLPIVCICGPSAAGKTTFAEALSEALRAVGRQPLLIACDNYYRQNWSPHPFFGFDTIDAIDYSALRVDLAEACQANAKTLRHYDMRSRIVSRRSVSAPFDIIVLEGAFGPQLLLNDFSLKALIYLDESILLRLWRRLRRDVVHRSRSPGYVIRQMLFEMLPGERHFIAPLKKQATFVVRHPKRDLRIVLDALG